MFCSWKLLAEAFEMGVTEHLCVGPLGFDDAS